MRNVDAGKSRDVTAAQKRDDGVSAPNDLAECGAPNEGARSENLSNHGRTVHSASNLPPELRRAIAEARSSLRAFEYDVEVTEERQRVARQSPI